MPRRDPRGKNLTRSADELRIQLEDAKEPADRGLRGAQEVELLDERDQARERAEESAGSRPISTVSA